MSDNQVFSTPTQPLDLPSKGLLYAKDNPLSSGVVELYLPTARHEDILTNRNYIQQGVVLDKFLQEIIASKIKYDDLITADKNAILVGARILAYGSMYSFRFKDPDSNEQSTVTVDLSLLKEKEVDFSLFEPGVNSFKYTMPMTKADITFKLLTHKDETAIEAEIKGIQKINKISIPEITTRLSYEITSVNGSTEKSVIRDFIKNMPIRDLKEYRKYVTSITPGIEMKFDYEKSSGEVLEGLSIPMTVDFFWPDDGV